MKENALGKATESSAGLGKEVTLIQCTKTKRDRKAKAKNLYDESTYFRKMRAYTEAKGKAWFILSAKHGLVDPETELAPYDAFGLSEQQAREIAEQLAGANTVEVVAGRKYTDPLIPELERRGVDVINNFAGMKIGERQQELAKRTKRFENQTLC